MRDRIQERAGIRHGHDDRAFRAVLLCVLLLTLVLLVPLAHASPPDQIWIAGSYDGDDHDSAVLEAGSLDGRTMPRACLVPVWLVVGDARAGAPPCRVPGGAVETVGSVRGAALRVSIGRSPPAR